MTTSNTTTYHTTYTTSYHPPPAKEHLLTPPHTTYTTSYHSSPAKEHLRTLPGLTDRIAAMLDINDATVDILWHALWTHFGWYVVPSSDDYTRWLVILTTN